MFRCGAKRSGYLEGEADDRENNDTLRFKAEQALLASMAVSVELVLRQMEKKSSKFRWIRAVHRGDIPCPVRDHLCQERQIIFFVSQERKVVDERQSKAMAMIVAEV